MSNREVVFDAVQMPFRAMAASAAFVGDVFVTSTSMIAATAGAVGGAAAMVFRRGRAFGIRIMRTRIDYTREVGDPIQNSIVGAVVAWKARNFPEAPVRIRREGAPIDDPGIVAGPTGPGFMLRLLERPNAYYSGVLQWQATMADFCRGNAYWIKIRGPKGPGGQLGRVRELWWVPQHMMEPAWPDNDPNVFIGWYNYAVDGRAYRVDKRDVVHFRNGIDPLNPRKGLGPLGTLMREIFTDEEASAFTASLLRNLGVPGVVLSPANTTTGNGPLQKDPKAIKEKFMETFGGDGRGEPLVLTAATEVKVLSWSPEQMNLRELRRLPEERISSSLGVPAGVVGLGAGLDRNTFSNYGEANRAAYTQGVIPEQRLIAAELEVQLLNEFVDTDTNALDVWFDYTQASAFAETLADIWKRHMDAATKGLEPRKAFLKATGQSFDEIEDDVYIIPNGWQIIPGGKASVQIEATKKPVPVPPQAPPRQPPGTLPQQSGGFVEVEPAAAATNGNGHYLEPTGAAA